MSNHNSDGGFKVDYGDSSDDYDQQASGVPQGLICENCRSRSFKKIDDNHIECLICRTVVENVAFNAHNEEFNHLAGGPIRTTRIPVRNKMPN